MVDPRFFPEVTPLSVARIVELTEGELLRGDSKAMASMLTPAGVAQSGALCFATSKAAAAIVPNKTGVICLIARKYAESLGENITAILTPDPKKAFTLVMRAMYPEPESKGEISPDAHIADDVVVGKDVRVDAGAIISSGVELGAGVWVKSGAVIGKGCIIGDNTVIEHNATITCALIGSNCHIGLGTAIGFDGFGIVETSDGYVTAPHFGRVIIGDNCSIGSNSTIDRGFLDDTTIGSNTMIDNLVQIAHNVKIGSGNIFCGQVGISGSVKIGDNNVFGGQCGVADHIKIGSGNFFASKAGIGKDVGDNMIMGGIPAVPMQDFHRQVISLRKLAASKDKPQNKKG